jgi:hypothetical protein
MSVRVWEFLRTTVDPQILVLELARRRVVDRRFGFLYGHGNYDTSELRGVPVRIIMVGLNCPDHALVATKEITSIKLRGKVLGGYNAHDCECNFD